MKTPWHALVVELVDVVELLGEGETAEDAEVAHHRLAPMLGLVWRLAIKGLGGRAVEEMDGSHHRLCPVDCRHPSLLEGVDSGHHRLVAALNDVVGLECRSRAWRRTSTARSCGGWCRCRGTSHWSCRRWTHCRGRRGPVARRGGGVRQRPAQEVSASRCSRA